MMMIRRLQSGPFAERARRSAREIVLAAALTFAALVFVATAAFHGSTPETAAVPPATVQDPIPVGAQPVDGAAETTTDTSWDATEDL